MILLRRNTKMSYLENPVRKFCELHLITGACAQACLEPSTKSMTRAQRLRAFLSDVSLDGTASISNFHRRTLLIRFSGSKAVVGKHRLDTARKIKVSVFNHWLGQVEYELRDWGTRLNGVSVPIRRWIKNHVHRLWEKGLHDLQGEPDRVYLDGLSDAFAICRIDL